MSEIGMANLDEKNWMSDEEIDDRTKEIGNEDPDWGYAKGKPLRVEEIEDGETYRTIAERWASGVKRADYEKMVDETVVEAPNGYAAYRFAWNGDRFSQEIAVRALGSYLGNELHLKASLMSQVFKTSGVAKRPYGSAGGGCTVFVKYGSDCEVGQGKKIRYKFDQEEGDAVSHVLVGDLFVDPMCGLQGKQLGVLVGDVSMTVWNPSQRIADLSQAIRRRLGIKGLRLKLKSDKVGDEWVMNIYTRGTGEQKREAVNKLRKGIDVDYDGWVRKLTVAGGAAQAIKQNRTAGAVRSEKRDENLRLADGREMKIYKLKAELAESAELQRKVEAQCTVYGDLEKSMYFAATTDGRAWAKATYATKEDAGRADENNALAVALSTEEFADADEGFVQTELVDAEFEIKKKASKAASKTNDVTAAVLGGGTVGNYKKAATEGDVKAIDSMIARVLESGRAMKVVKEQMVKEITGELRTSFKADLESMIRKFKLTVREETVAAVQEGLGPVQKVLQSLKNKKVVPDSVLKPKAGTRKRLASDQSGRQRDEEQEGATQQLANAIKILKSREGGSELMTMLFPGQGRLQNNTDVMDWDDDSE